MSRSSFLPSLRPWIDDALRRIDDVPEDRRARLRDIAAFVADKTRAGDEARLTFICTHNSRRSHMAAVGAQVAASVFGVPGVRAYSGGVEATACDIRTVRALRRAGFSVVDSTGGGNPVYLVRFSDDEPPSKAFSKIHNRDGNPESEFAAVMTCSDADRRCPVVTGSARRIALPYDDPKNADGTDTEDAVYDERLRHIAIEQLRLMAETKELSSV